MEGLIKMWSPTGMSFSTRIPVQNQCAIVLDDFLLCDDSAVRAKSGAKVFSIFLNQLY